MKYLVKTIFSIVAVKRIAFSFYFSAFIRVQLIPLVGGVLDYASIFPQFLLATILIISLFALNGLYHCIGKTGISESKQVFKITTIAFISLGLAIFILRTNVNFSRLVFLSTWLLCMMSIAIIRSAIHNRGSLQSWWSQPAVVIGKRVDIERVVMFLFRSRRMAIKPVVEGPRLAGRPV